MGIFSAALAIEGGAGARRWQNKKKMSSLINARNSVFAEKTLAPEFIPWFNMKDVSWVSALLTLSAGWVITTPHTH